MKPLLLLAGGTIGALLIKAYTLNKLGKSNHSDLVRDVLGSRSRSDRPPTRSTENILTTDLLHKLEWKRFEDLVQGYYEAKGHRAEQTGPGADGGVDIFLYDPSNHRPTTYVQCKSWFGTDVGVEKVRELFGVMARDAVPHGIFLTTSGYTPDARAFAKGQPLELIDGVTFIERFNLLPANSRQRILNGVTEGDYWTPSCPKCEVKMVFRDNAKNPFWGCRRFPKCHSKIYPRSSVKAMP